MTKRVTVVLQQAVAGLGEKGEVQTVTFGYAKNFLLPRKLAVLATPTAVRVAVQAAAARSRSEQRRQNDDALFRQRLNKVRVVLPVRVNANGVPFGSVGVPEIHQRLAEAGFALPESAILLKSKLHAVGEHRVVVKTSDGQAEVTVVVEPKNDGV